MTYDNVSRFDKLKPRLPDYDVDNVHYVSQNVTNDPVDVDIFIVVREGHPGSAKPNIVVVYQCYHGHPGNIPMIWRERDIQV